MPDPNTLRRVNWLWKHRHKNHDDIERRITIIERRSEEDSSGSGGADDGAHFHLILDAAQSMADGGEAIVWTGADPVHPRLNMDLGGGTEGTPAAFPNSEILVRRSGYYDVGLEFDWSTFTGGGSVWITRTRDGVETTVYPTSLVETNAWQSTYGANGVFIAKGLTFNLGDIIQVYVDPQSGQAEDLAIATLTVELVETGDPTSSGATGSGYREMVLDDGPIAYWRLGELSGTTAVDETGNGHTGTYLNSPTLGVDGLIVDPDTAVTFDPAAPPDRVGVTVANLSQFNVSSITLEAWLRTSATSGEQTIISRDNDGGFARVFTWRVHTTAGTVDFLVLEDNGFGTLATLSGVTDVRDGLIHHVVLTYDGTTAILYLDGSVDASDTLSTALEVGSVAPVRLATRDVDQQPFDGTLDEVVVYGRVLSAAEVTEHHDKGVNG